MHCDFLMTSTVGGGMRIVDSHYPLLFSLVYESEEKEYPFGLEEGGSIKLYNKVAGDIRPFWHPQISQETGLYKLSTFDFAYLRENFSTPNGNSDQIMNKKAKRFLARNGLDDWRE